MPEVNAKSVEVGQYASYVDPTTGHMISGPLIYIDQKPCIASIGGYAFCKLLANMMMHGGGKTTISIHDIPIVFIKNPDTDTVYIREDD